jgi:hypothetical protein
MKEKIPREGQKRYITLPQLFINLKSSKDIQAY